MSSQSNANPSAPPGIVHPSFHQQRPRPEGEMAWNVRRYGQFKNAQDTPHPVPVQGNAHHQNGGWANAYRRASYGSGPGEQLPLQPIQPSVPLDPMQWTNFNWGGAPQNGFDRSQRSQPHFPPQYPPSQLSGNHPTYGPSHLQAVVPHNGAPGQTQHPGHSRPTFYNQGQRPRTFSMPHAPPPPRITVIPPDPEATPRPQMPDPQLQKTPRFVRDKPIPLHSWKDISEVPQASGMHVPHVPPIDLHLIAKVGDPVRIKPWADQHTWIVGCVEKADFSMIENHEIQPRYIVSYTDPESKQLKQRMFCPHLFEITVLEPVEPGSKPLPKGAERDIYACIPPPVVQVGTSIEKVWAHARVLTPPNENDEINIRVLVGPSKNLLFENFPTKYTMPFRRASRARVLKEGYEVAGSDEHPMEEDA
ncbi:hypothetical protein MSAN_01014500 [Mycena sanguinolenta]|uniref:Uncharacterized protein n=1 Tax=Mycena sanguinolenta TaxID=230812 RepID=A0A8H6YP47_9AGAR|nr:hypothetical protein MSAN_01014500 [Mycena sanguinolenta]